MLTNLKPMLASSRETAFSDPAWVYELKWDGVRIQAQIRGRQLRLISRNGRDVTTTPLKSHPDDKSREDLVALDPGESTVIYRGFRDFVGPYVAHCHNLAHEDHAMMFGWEITP